MSAFDDEFGLFGDDAPPADDADRKPTLGARKIASSESGGDDVEFEDERPRRMRRDGAEGGAATGDRPRWRDRPSFADRGARKSDPDIAQARATDLLEFLAKGLVTKPEEVFVEKIETGRGPVVELEVHPDDLGKVIGRGGRVAQALRTLVRASAEGRIGVDIVDVEDEYEDDDADADGDAPAGPSGSAEHPE